MKIAIDCRLIGTGHGGIGRYTFELVKNLLALDKENTYFLFFNSAEKELVASLVWEAKKEGNAGPECVEVNIRHYSLMEQLKFGSILASYNFDLVHFPNFNVPLAYSRPFVVTIHDMVHHKISGHKKSRLVHFFVYKKVIENAARKAQKIVTVSETAKKDIKNILTVPQEKIAVIYEGPSLKDDVEESDVEDIKKRLFLKKPYFLAVGVLERKKNIVNLARGFDEFLQKYKLDMDLVVVGKADEHYPGIKFHALQIKNSSHLVFTGQVSDRQLKSLYKGAYAYVSASMHEGFGLPGVEAMQFNLPLVVSNTEVFNEIYDNAAVYFNPASAGDIAEKLFLMARDPGFHSQMQEKSFYRGQNFSWKKTAQETLDLYKSL